MSPSLRDARLGRGTDRRFDRVRTEANDDGAVDRDGRDRARRIERAHRVLVHVIARIAIGVGDAFGLEPTPRLPAGRAPSLAVEIDLDTARRFGDEPPMLGSVV